LILLQSSFNHSQPSRRGVTNLVLLFPGKHCQPTGINPVALRDLPGHSTIAITADLYSHLETNYLKQDVAASGKMLRKEK
jgi:hypothetical protein